MSQRLTVTLPDEIYNQLKEQAARDYRTIGAEITYLLQLHVPSYRPVMDFIPQPENPTGSPTLTNNTIDNTTTYFKRKETI